MKLTESQIEQALSRFGAGKVAAHMAAVGWVWAFPAERTRVPTAAEVMTVARRLLERLAWDNGAESTYSVATGGLHASLVLDDSGQPSGARVAFEISYGHTWWEAAEREAERQKGEKR